MSEDGPRPDHGRSTKSPCCAPQVERPRTAGPPVTVAAAPEPPANGDMRVLAGSSFLIGSDDRWAYPADGEGPVREVSVPAFWVDPCAVSNDDFSAFVEATGYATEAERFGWSFVFAGLLPDDFPPTQAVVHVPWWRRVEGADWRRPEGPQSSVDTRGGHPVVHVSWTDAQAYCSWANTIRPGATTAAGRLM